MLGLVLRFISGVVVGVPIAIIAYYSLPVFVSDITATHIAFIGATAASLGALRPSLLLKGLACSYIWNKI